MVESGTAEQVIAAKVREELARRRMSRQQLADMARVSISTLEKALNGSRAFTLATIVRLETALGIALRPDVIQAGMGAPPQRIGAAPAEHGQAELPVIIGMEIDMAGLVRH